MDILTFLDLIIVMLHLFSNRYEKQYFKNKIFQILLSKKQNVVMFKMDIQTIVPILNSYKDLRLEPKCRISYTPRPSQSIV